MFSIIILSCVFLLLLWLTQHSGQGGKFNNGTTDVPIAEWELTRNGRFGEGTLTNSGHVIRRFVIEDGTFRFNVPLDSENLLDTDLGVEPGASLSGADFFLGDSTKFYSFTALVDSLQIVCNATNDIVRCVVTGFINSTVTEPIT